MVEIQRDLIYFRDYIAYAAVHSLMLYLLTFLVILLEHYIPFISSDYLTGKIVIFYCICLTADAIYRQKNYPAGPPPLPIIGNSLFINIVSPELSFLEYRKIYGPVFTLHLGKPTIILADYDAIQEGMIGQGVHTSGRSSSESFVLFTGDRVNGDGVILAMGQKWKEMRAEITRFFGRIYGNEMDELILHHTRSLEYEMKKISDCNSLVDIRDPLAGAIANVIQQITIGRTFLFQDQEFQDQMKDINAVVREIMTLEVFLVNKFPILRHLPDGILPKWTTYKKCGFRLQDWFRKLLVNHLSERHQGDFMSHMVDKQEAGKTLFKDLSIILTCGDIWTGGMETTVTTLRWGIIYMLKNQDIQARCHEEIVKVFGNEEPDMRRTTETPFVRATISEIQRLANVLPWAIPHKTTSACVINEKRIPVNTEIIPALGVILSDPVIYPEPSVFNPERFLDEFGNYKSVEQFRPFGMGPRVCLGERIARTELYLIFCSLIQNFRFYLNDDDPIPSTKRVVGGITAPPENYCTRVEYLKVREIR